MTGAVKASFIRRMKRIDEQLSWTSKDGFWGRGRAGKDIGGRIKGGDWCWCWGERGSGDAPDVWKP